MNATSPEERARQLARINRLYARLIRRWRKRDNYAPYSSKWLKWDRRCNRRIEKLSRRLERYGLYTSDWHIVLYNRVIHAEQ